MASAFTWAAEAESAPMLEEQVPAAAPAPHRSAGWAGRAAVASGVLLLLSALALAGSRGGLPHSAEEAAAATVGTRGIVSLAEEGDDEAGGSSDFDCKAGYKNWEKGWSDEKIRFCCEKFKFACYSMKSGFLPAIVVQDFTKDDEKHEHCLTVKEGDIVFTSAKHADDDDWIYVYTRWYLNSPHGFVPLWALNRNVTKVARAFTHKEDSKDHEGCISVELYEPVFVQDKHDSGWSWVSKIKTGGEAPEKVDGWVPDWALTTEGGKGNGTEGEEADE